MKCESCGQVIPATAQVCSACGHSTDTARRIRTDQIMLIVFAAVGVSAIVMFTLYAVL